MSLPYLKQKQVAGLIIQHRSADGDKQDAPENEQYQGVIACAEAAIRAIHAKDASALAKAWQDAFEIMESQPHQEAEPTTNEGGE